MAVLLNIAALVSSCGGKISEADSAQTIFVNGDIVTVNERQPVAEAVAVKDGRIIAVGSVQRS